MLAYKHNAYINIYKLCIPMYVYNYSYKYIRTLLYVHVYLHLCIDVFMYIYIHLLISIHTCRHTLRTFKNDFGNFPLRNRYSCQV